MPSVAIEGIGTFYSPVGEWVVVVFNSTSGGNLGQTDITVSSDRPMAVIAS